MVLDHHGSSWISISSFPCQAYENYVKEVRSGSDAHGLSEVIDNNRVNICRHQESNDLFLKLCSVPSFCFQVKRKLVRTGQMSLCSD